MVLADSVAAEGGHGTAIPGDELHIWHAVLDRSASEVRSLHRLLAPDERARAARFHFERDRHRYIAGRGILRRLLGRYLSVAAADVEIVYGLNDKPILAGRALWFNVTHSGPVALFGFSGQAELGIDVELDQLDFAQNRIAERFFSPGEVATLLSLPESLQPRGFLTCWTRKEAFIKARGDGLSLPLDSFDVSLGGDSPAVLLRTAWSGDEPGQWYLQDISDPERGYVAALAIRSQGCRVIKRDVSQDFDDYRDIQEEEL